MIIAYLYCPALLMKTQIKNRRGEEGERLLDTVDRDTLITNFDHRRGGLI